MEAEEEVRSGRGWAGLGARSVSGPLLQVGVDSAAPLPLTAAPVCCFLCIHLHICSDHRSGNWDCVEQGTT